MWSKNVDKTQPEDIFKANSEVAESAYASDKKAGRKRGANVRTKEESSYSARDIMVLTGLEPVRKRPGLYIGGIDETALHHLVWEIMDNSIDEVMNGYADKVDIVLDKDGQGIRITDNGRGIPVDTHQEYGKSALELIMTTLHAGGKFANSNYQYSGGLHGVGSSVVNALSTVLEVTVKRDGGEWFQAYHIGQPTCEVTRVKDCGARTHGTSIWFRPDPEIFPVTTFNPQVILETLEAQAWLHRVHITFKDRVNGVDYDLDHADQGLDGYLDQLVQGEDRVEGWEKSFVLKREEEPRLELALQWCQTGGESLRSFVNGVRTPQGGTHDLGLRTGVVRAVRNYMDTHNLQPRTLKLSAEDIREGMRGVLSVYVQEPQFKGQTKDRLNNVEVTAQVAGVVAPALESFLNENGSLAHSLVERIISGAKEKAAVQAATEAVVRKSVTKRLNLPGKLADCSSNRPQDSELFIVEGDSAGGSAKQARDRRHQAILPLRGKILNTEQAGPDKFAKNKEITSLASAIGCGLGNKYCEDHLRYGRIVILTDADSDGHHIASLLLAFFYRYMPELIRNGHVFLGRPPLFRVAIGNKVHWAWDEGERDRLVRASRSRSTPNITRFKGLGEMSPAQLKETTMDPQTRMLFRVQIADRDLSDSAISDCFGRDTAPRFKFVMECVASADELDI